MILDRVLQIFTLLTSDAHLFELKEDLSPLCDTSSDLDPGG